jgi:tetratricopeptide (TPR) repeat protein
MTTLHWRVLLLIGIGMVASGCERNASSSRPSASPPAAVGGADGDAGAQIPPPRTTNGAIALRNFEAELAHAEQRLSEQPTDPQRLRAMVDLRMVRAQFLGVLADYDQALELADRRVQATPEDPQAYLQRANVRGRLHHFEEALADLTKAERRGLKGLAIDEPRAAILQATGQVAEALRLHRAAAEERPRLETLAGLAGLMAEEGRFEEAEKLYAQARAAYRDVSPFPVAWLEFQEGLLWESAGNLERAGQSWAAAHARLPAYSAAATHLAEVEAAAGRTEKAIALLRPVVERSDDPEYAAQLAGLLRGAGKEAEAQQLLARAKAGFEHWTARHPLAFADHAARFWLGLGADPRKALALAETNLASRRTAEALELYWEAVTAADAKAQGCKTVKGLLASGEGLLPASAEKARTVLADCR